MRQLSQPLLGAWSYVTGLGTEGHTAEPPSALCRGVLALWERFTRERSGLRSSYLDEARGRQAYLAYYFPVNVAKVQALLDEMPEPMTGPNSPAEPFTILDVGCGPGTAALGVLDWASRHPSLQRMPVHLVAMDASSGALQDCERLWSAYVTETGSMRAKLATVRGDLERSTLPLGVKAVNKPYDVIVVANVLNELFRNARDPVGSRCELVRSLVDLLAPQGTLIIIEPALRETSRRLLQLRDLLLHTACCTVYSPCLHEGRCPALIKEDDWCHEERPWTPPPLVAAIDRRIGFIKDSLKFSYLLLRKDGKQIVRRSPSIYRVVSELRAMKGEQRAWLCNETGRPEVGRLDRERSEANAAFDGWHRGAIVKVDEIVRNNRKGRAGTVGRIQKPAAVEMLRPVEGD